MNFNAVIKICLEHLICNFDPNLGIKLVTRVHYHYAQICNSIINIVLHLYIPKEARTSEGNAGFFEN